MRRLVAALAVRAGSTRLYAKPLQRLTPVTTILDQLVDLLSRVPAIDDIVLGVAEGRENWAFEAFAHKRGLRFVIESEQDVLRRLIRCGEASGATDVMRITTENPFRWHERLVELWNHHVENRCDLSVTQRVPYGTNVEVFTVDALRRSHDRGGAREREHCSLYIREHRAEFRVHAVDGDPSVRRPDLRLSVDNPEDLILARAVYAAFEAQAPLVPVADIVAFLDSRPDLVNLVRPFATPSTPWT